MKAATRTFASFAIGSDEAPDLPAFPAFPASKIKCQWGFAQFAAVIPGE